MSATKLKLLEILDILKDTNDTHPITAPQIREKLRLEGIEAERKSICRDINTLIEYGHDINLCSDNKLGYYYGKREFEDWELKVLIDAIWQAKFLTDSCTESLAERLKNLACSDSRKLLTAVTPVKSGMKCTNLSVKINIDKLLTAIRKKKRVQFQYVYTDSELKKQYRKSGKYYVINPYLLVWQDDRYYLICNTDKYDDLSYYRLDRMKNLSISDEAVKPATDIIGANADLKIREYVTKSIYRYSGDDVMLTLRINADMVDELIDYFGENIRIEKTNGLFDVSINVMESEGLYYWLLQHGENIEIISPQKIRDNFIQKIDGISKRYKK